MTKIELTQGKTILPTDNPPRVAKSIDTQNELSNAIQSNYLPFFGTVEVPSDNELIHFGITQQLSDDATDFLDSYNETDDPSYTEQQLKIYFESDMVAKLGGEYVEYIGIDHDDSISVFLANLGNNIGHLKLVCGDNRVKTSFVKLNDAGQIIMSKNNINPNPIPQIGHDQKYRI